MCPILANLVSQKHSYQVSKKSLKNLILFSANSRPLTSITASSNDSFSSPTKSVVLSKTDNQHQELSYYLSNNLVSTKMLNESLPGLKNATSLELSLLNKEVFYVGGSSSMSSSLGQAVFGVLSFNQFLETIVEVQIEQ